MTIQKVLWLLAIVILHILWIFSIKQYYDTTYKKYLETSSDFDWAFVFKKKKIPFTETYNILFEGQKIGTLTRKYSKTFHFFKVTTQVEIQNIKIPFYVFPVKYNTITLHSEIELTPLYNINTLEFYLVATKCPLANYPCTNDVFIALKGRKVGKKMKITLESKLPPLNNANIEVGEKYLKGSLWQSFLLFGSRPAVGKSWKLSVGTFAEITAVVEEKFIKEDQRGKKIVIYSVSYSSERPKINGYAWITEDGEVLQFILYKPNIALIKKGYDFK